MPQFGATVIEGTIDKWLKSEGDFVKLEEPLVEITTDKVNAELPSPLAGRLLRILVGAGATVAVGVDIAEIDVDATDDDTTRAER
jgi:pyruvate/2-oxoglutarate dehydrogenase complex dihydrolipoamide acyltransferase (E2) component